MLLLLLHGGGFAELRTQQGGSCMHVGHKPFLSISTSSCTSTSTSSFHFRSTSSPWLPVGAPGRLGGAAVFWCSGALVRFSSGIANPDKPIFPNGVRAGPLAVLACPALGRWQAAPAGVAPSSCRTRRGWGEELQGLSLNLGDLN